MNWLEKNRSSQTKCLKGWLLQPGCIITSMDLIRNFLISFLQFLTILALILPNLWLYLKNMSRNLRKRILKFINSIIIEFPGSVKWLQMRRRMPQFDSWLLWTIRTNIKQLKPMSCCAINIIGCLMMFWLCRWLMDMLKLD